jgi:hypothetical protein
MEGVAIPLSAETQEQALPLAPGAPDLHDLPLPTGPVPRSKYEMNLAEFPISILSKRFPKDLKAIERLSGN